MFWLQGFIEGTFTEIMPWQIDVRDIGRAHVRAAEVGHFYTQPSSSLSPSCSPPLARKLVTTAGGQTCTAGRRLQQHMVVQLA